MNLVQLSNWYRTVLGKEIAMAESQYISQLLAKLPGSYLLQLGQTPLSWLNASRIMHKSVVDEQIGKQITSLVVAEFTSLPFPRELFDVVVLPHIVDCKQNYPVIIAEAARVLNGEGYLLILGFNPYSLGALSRAKPPLIKAPSVYKLRYWLRKANCEVIQIKTFFYRPLIQSENVLQKLKVLETVGPFFLPCSGVCYVMVARKKIMLVTPLRQKLKNWWRHWLSKPIAEPSTRTRCTKL